jgi:hypothetical protein
MNTLALEKPISFKTWHLFLFLLFGISINIWISQNYILTREVYHNLLSEQLEISRIDDYFNLIQRFSIWTYILSPIMFLLRLIFVSLLIQFPLVMKFIDIPLKQIFRIVTFAFIPLFLMSVIKTIWLLLLPTHQITQETLTFTPLTFTNFLNASNYAKTVYGLLSNLNIFEVVWCFIVAKGLSRTGKIKKSDAYVLVLVIWTLILVFLWALLMYLTKINS